MKSNFTLDDTRKYNKLVKVTGTIQETFQDGVIYEGSIVAFLEYQPMSLVLGPEVQKAYFCAIPKEVDMFDMGFAGMGIRTSSIQEMEEIPGGYRIKTRNSTYELTGE